MNKTATNDLLFKKTFTSEGSQDILKNFVEDLTGQSFESVEPVNTYDFYYKETKDNLDKIIARKVGYTEVDVRAKTSDGSQVTIEMQVANQEHFKKRCLYYAFKTYVRKYDEAEDPESSDRFGKLRPVYSINITDFDVFDQAKAFQSFALTDKIKLSEVFRREGKEIDWLEDIHISFLSLKNNELPDEDDYPRTKQLGYWQMFFRGEELPKEAPDYIKRAEKLIDYSNLGSEEKKLVQTISKAQADYLEQLAYAEKKGIEKGIVQGREEGIEKGEKRGLEKGREEGIGQGIQRAVEKLMREGLLVKKYSKEELMKLLDKE